MLAAIAGVPRRRGQRAGDVGEVARAVRQAQAAHAARAHRPAARPRRAVPRADAARRLPHARRQGRLERGRRLGRRHRLCRGRALRRVGVELAPSRAAPWRRPASARASACSRSSWRTSCRSCTWSNRAAPTCSTRPRSSCRAAAASPTRRACRRAASRRSPSCTAPRPPAAPTCRASRDYVIMVRNQAKVFLAGPPLLKAATGEIATDEELGGAEMHATVSGVAEWMAENDADGIRMAREVIAKWHWNDKLPPKHAPAVQGPALRHRRAVRRRAAVAQGSLRRARGDRAAGRRLGLPRIQGPLRPADDLRLGRDRGRAGRPSSATTGRSPPRARSRPRSSSSSAASRARRSSTCRTPPATWSAPRPSAAASSSTAPR